MASELVKQRLAICYACPDLLPNRFKNARRCKHCGCIMAAKAQIRSMECPLGKWKAEKKPPV